MLACGKYQQHPLVLFTLVECINLQIYLHHHIHIHHAGCQDSDYVSVERGGLLLACGTC